MSNRCPTCNQRTGSTGSVPETTRRLVIAVSLTLMVYTLILLWIFYFGPPRMGVPSMAEGRWFIYYPQALFVVLAVSSTTAIWSATLHQCKAT
jgi:hypothetical protein